jgi:heptosyltransferase III
VIPWEGASVTALLASGADTPLPAELACFDVAVAYTRSEDVGRRLKAGIRRVLSHDPAPPPDEGVHASIWLSRPMADLGLGAEEPPTQSPSAAEARATEALRGRLGHRFLAIHPGSGSARKNWPAERFAQVAEATAAGRPWLLVEGPADASGVRLLAGLNGATRAKDLPLRVLGALLSQAGVYVGNDSGVSHLAAAWGAPTVALFGPTDSAVWSPVGAKVRVVRSADRTLESLSVSEVESAVRATLAQVSGG